MIRDEKHIPNAVIKRLTKYLTCVQDLLSQGEEWVSSHELAEILSLTSSTVRQDLTYIDFSGISKKGYECRTMITVLSRLLGADIKWNVVVVGAGNLGKALALHEEFARRGFNICGIFDVDKNKIGEKVGKLVVRNLKDMPKMISSHDVDIGIMAVPSMAAQNVADLLIASGIKGLLNLSLTHIIVPRKVAIIDSRVIASLMELTHSIKSKRV